MRELKHSIGPRRADTIQTEIFLEWADTEKNISPETIGEMIAVAESRPPQRGWYSEEYVRSETDRINYAIGWLRIIADEYLTVAV